MATTTSNTDFNAFVNSTTQLSIALTPILISLYLVVSFVKYVRRWWGANLVPESHQREARRLQSEFDSVSELPRDLMDVIRDGDGEVVRRKPRKGNAGWWMAYAVMARGKFHDPSNTVAMRRSIHKWIYEQMEADKVTKLDIARVVHRAVEWTYHADVSEVKAGMDRNSRAMVEREIDYTAPWWSYWWGVSRRTAGNGQGGPVAVPGRDSEDSLAPNPTGLEVRYILGATTRTRHTYMVGEGMSPPREVYAFNSTIVNLLKAVKERVFYVKENGVFVSPPRPGSRMAYAMKRKDARDAGCCSICREDFVALAIASQLPCGHTYHLDCIDGWVTHCREARRDVTCPMCRDSWSPPSDAETIYDNRLGAIQKRILELCPRLSPLEREEFPLLYEGKKRSVYQNAVESLYVRGIRRKDGELSNFTKTERTTKQGAVPRNISPRDPRYNVEVGRVIKPAEGILLNGVTRLLGSKTVMKGMNASQVGAEFSRKWECMGGDGQAVAIGLDASRFDQHVSRQALEWEHKFYLGLLTSPKDRKWLANLLTWQIHNKAFGRCADGWLRYEIEGTRCSGDMNTGLGNCLIACCLLIAYCTEREVPFELANNGDDCVIICHKRHLARFSAGLDLWFREMGFNMVVEEPVYELEKVVFCQSQPVFDGASWTMVRDPRSCIVKDCISLKPWCNAKEYESWIKCVGMSGTSLAGGIPVLDSFYRSFMRAGRDAKPLRLSDPTLIGGLFWQSKGMHRRNLSVSEAARYSFWRAFDITPDEQVAIESEYNATTPFYQEVRKDWEFLPTHEHTLLM